MKRSPSLSGPDLKAAIAATKDFPASPEKSPSTRTGNAVKAAVVLKVKDGKPNLSQKESLKDACPRFPPF